MISHRLQEILDWVDTGVLADVGCDHAYIAVEAVKTGRARKAYAMDTARGPLDNAVKTIAEAGLEEQVIPILSDGLEKMPEDVQMILIAGMGGTLAVQILEEGKEKLNDSIQLLLSVHKDAPALRRWLLENGWRIRKEKVIQEGSHFYPLLLAEKGSQQADEQQLEMGIHPEDSLARRNWLDYLEKKYAAILEKHPVPDIARKLEWVREEKNHP